MDHRRFSRIALGLLLASCDTGRRDVVPVAAPARVKPEAPPEAPPPPSIPTNGPGGNGPHKLCDDVVAPSASSTAPQALECGAVVSANATLEADLDCSQFVGIPLSIQGDNIHFDGKGHKIRLSPATTLGMIVSGQNISIDNLKIHPYPTGVALRIESASNVVVAHSDFSCGRGGVEIVAAGSVDASDVTLQDNLIRETHEFALQLARGTTGRVRRPRFLRNDFTGSAGWFLQADAEELLLSGDQANVFEYFGSGVELRGGSARLEKLDLSSRIVAHEGFKASDLSTLVVSDSNFSNLVAGTPKVGSYGIVLQRIGTLELTHVHSNNYEIGMRILSSNGIASEVSVHDSEFTGNLYSGIQIQALDATTFARLTVKGNDLRLNPGIPPQTHGLIIEPGTLYQAGSELGPNTTE